MRTGIGMGRLRDRLGFVALGVAAAAAVAAGLAARGPAVAERAEFSWPSNRLPAASPTRAWVTPLLLARHFPAGLTARVPCGDEQVLPGAGRAVVLLATARDAVRWNALQVVRSADTGETVVRVGRKELARVPRAAAGTRCSLGIHLDETSWTVSPVGAPSRSGSLSTPPGVAGLITELDLRARPGLTVSVLPIPLDTHASSRQTALRILAGILVAAAAALILVAGRRRTREVRFGGVAPQDVVVAVVLAAWWLLAPLQDDDGWVRARQTNSLASGGFSNYYEHWGANLPLATWLEWMQHFLVAHSSSLAFHRLPSVLLMAGTWIVCRVALARRPARTPRRRDPALWAAAATFAAGSVAFGNTLRPEPVIALLAAVILVACLAYLARPAVDLLLLAVLLVGLATTVHPSGVVAGAPLVICLPQIARDVRKRTIAASQLLAVFVIGVAWTLLLAFLDADTESRATSVDLIRAAGGHSDGVFQEVQRYGRLGEPGASPLRRMFVGVLLLLAVASVVSLVKRGRPLADRLPAASVALSLVFLSVTPSKWIWHFGAFVGVAAVAAGFETDRLSEARVSGRLRAAAGAAVLVVAVAAGVEANHWGPLDVGRLDWSITPGFYVLASVVTFAGVVVGGRLGAVPTSAVVVLPALLATMVVVTIVTFLADTATTHGWTAARQAAGSLVGRDRCGVASDLVAATPTGPPARQPAVSSGTRQVSSVTETGRTRLPVALDRTGSTPWYAIGPAPVGIFVGGAWAPHDRLDVMWGRAERRRVLELDSGTADLLQSTDGPDFARWRFVAESSFPVRPAAADRVRFRVTASDGQSSPQITSPTGSLSRPLERLVDGGARTLVSPFLFEGMPCARLPSLSYGVAAIPNMLVDWVPVPSLTNPTSPWAGLAEVLNLERVPVRSSVDRGPIFVYTVRVDPRDAVAPARRSIVS
jgi:hypothetical protein